MSIRPMVTRPASAPSALLFSFGKPSRFPSFAEDHVRHPLGKPDFHSQPICRHFLREIPSFGESDLVTCHYRDSHNERIRNSMGFYGIFGLRFAPSTLALCFSIFRFDFFDVNVRFWWSMLQQHLRLKGRCYFPARNILKM